MENNLPKNISEICLFLKKAETAEDFLVVQFISSNIFCNKNVNEIDKILMEQGNFYISAIENVFDNQNFINAVIKILEQYKAFKKNYKEEVGQKFFEEFDKIEIKNKKLVFAALTSSIILLMAVFENLSKENILYTSNKLKECLGQFKEKLNPQYSSSEIYTIISGVFNRKFYSRLAIRVEMENSKHCFLKQNTSSYMINLIFKLSFKSAILNNSFKSLEKGRLLKKVGLYNVYRLSNLINNELKYETNTIKELVQMLNNSKNIMPFINYFKSDKNEENAFNIIAITLQKFETSKTIENDLIETVNNAEKLMKEIKEYSIKNFKAFSGDIKEYNNEWSNKIFINCSKLLGAIGSLSTARDKAWQIDASVKEFADWICSIHKILNKYDIEDDWDKISKYLNQETNKVEWKSNFFTPTQIKKDDIKYNEISHKCFLKIVRTILGMINTDGGVIIIGIVENPEDIIEKDIKDSLLYKNKKYFFNVSEELLIKNLDLDGVKRKIQDVLKKETLTSVDTFNNLWNIEQIFIKSEDGTKEFSVFKIEISKANKLIYSVLSKEEIKDNEKTDLYKTENVENIWISLLKRADGRTIYVDPREKLDL